MKNLDNTTMFEVAANISRMLGRLDAEHHILTMDVDKVMDSARERLTDRITEIEVAIYKLEAARDAVNEVIKHQ